MNLKNTIENAVIAIITLILTTAIIYLVAILPLTHQISELNQTVEELARLEKYKIENSFKKVKTNKDGEINLQINSELNNNSKDSTTIVKKEKKRKKFLGIF